jgi:hypothetical protein
MACAHENASELQVRASAGRHSAYFAFVQTPNHLAQFGREAGVLFIFGHSFCGLSAGEGVRQVSAQQRWGRRREGRVPVGVVIQLIAEFACGLEQRSNAVDNVLVQAVTDGFQLLLAQFAVVYEPELLHDCGLARLTGTQQQDFERVQRLELGLEQTLFHGRGGLLLHRRLDFGRPAAPGTLYVSHQHTNTKTHNTRGPHDPRITFGLDTADICKDAAAHTYHVLNEERKETRLDTVAKEGKETAVSAEFLLTCNSCSWVYGWNFPTVVRFPFPDLFFFQSLRALLSVPGSRAIPARGNVEASMVTSLLAPPTAPFIPFASLCIHRDSRLSHPSSGNDRRHVSYRVYFINEGSLTSPIEFKEVARRRQKRLMEKLQQ